MNAKEPHLEPTVLVYAVHLLSGSHLSGLFFIFYRDMILLFHVRAQWTGDDQYLLLCI